MLTSRPKPRKARLIKAISSPRPSSIAKFQARNPASTLANWRKRTGDDSGRGSLIGVKIRLELSLSSVKSLGMRLRRMQHPLQKKVVTAAPRMPNLLDLSESIQYRLVGRCILFVSKPLDIHPGVNPREWSPELCCINICLVHQINSKHRSPKEEEYQ